MTRTAGIIASVVVVASGCVGSSKPPLLTATLTGSTVDSTFEAVVSYPATVRSGTEVMSYGADFPHGTDLRFPMNFRNTGGGVANFDFDIAYDGPSNCKPKNVMAWSDVRADTRRGAAEAVIRNQRLSPDTNHRALGLWPNGGYGLKDESETVRTRRDMRIPKSCTGKFAFVAVARPDRREAIVRRFTLTVT